MACHAAASARRPCPLSFRRHGSGRMSGRLRRSPFAAIYRRDRRGAVEHGLGYTAVPAPLTGTSKLTSILLLCTVQRTLYYVVCRWYLPSHTWRDHAGSCITWRRRACRYGRTIPGARRVRLVPLDPHASHASAYVSKCSPHGAYAFPLKDPRPLRPTAPWESHLLSVTHVPLHTI